MWFVSQLRVKINPGTKKKSAAYDYIPIAWTHDHIEAVNYSIRWNKVATTGFQFGLPDYIVTQLQTCKSADTMIMESTKRGQPNICLIGAKI